MDEKFMQLAIDKARLGGQKDQTPFGACIVKNNELICCGHNVVWATTDITAHAEVRAIREACNKLNTIDLSGCTIYSTCEPCPMCFSAIHWAKIDKIFFGAKISDAQGVNFNELTISNQQMKELGGSPVEIVGDFMKKECQALFREWDKSGDKKVY